MTNQVVTVVKDGKVVDRSTLEHLKRSLTNHSTEGIQMNHTQVDLQSALGQFIGTERYHYNPLYPWMRYTDGVQFFAQKAGAYWFLDILGTELMSKVRRNPFMSITMDVKDGTANIIVTDGNDGQVWSRKEIYTDCPAGEWRFFLTDKVLMLTSEY